MPIISRCLAALLLPLLCAACGSTEQRRSAVVMHPAARAAEAWGFVDVRTYLPDVSVDLRYATSQNVARQPVYPADMPCLLRQSTAEKLKRVQARLRSKGLGLRIWDAWRPPEVQLTLSEKDGGTGMFLDPGVAWSRHCSGVSVDVTLIDMNGVEQRMPTYHDENSDRAHHKYSGNDPVIRRNLNLLQNAMCDEGFSMIELEWWHFDDHEHFFNPPPVVWAKDLDLELPKVD